MAFLYVRTSLNLLSTIHGPARYISSLDQINNNIGHLNKAGLHVYYERKELITNSFQTEQLHLRGDYIKQRWSNMNKDFRCVDPVRRPRQDQLHTRNTDWQLFDLDGVKNHILVYSAFYDDRNDTGIIPVIRILGVANKAHDTLYCQLWFADADIPQIVTIVIKKSGRGDNFDGIFYTQDLYSCKLISALPRPTHVSLTTEPCMTSSIMLPITWKEWSVWQDDFAICVPIGFGMLDTLDLLEWFEMVKLLGISNVHVYNATMSPNLNKVLNFYTQSGFLKVHQMAPPVNHFTKKGSKLASPAALNDCMLRYMYTYRYIFFIDFDELILPQTASNYTQLLKDMNKYHNLKEDHPSYTFRNAYHFLDLKGQPREKEYMKFLKYNLKAPPSKYLFAPKSMIDPRRCLSVFNHYCYIKFPVASKPFTIDVSTNLAMSHHYRKCNLGRATCKDLFSKSKYDNTFLRFQHMIRQRVEAIIPAVT